MTIPLENIPDALLISYYHYSLKHTQAPFGHSWNRLTYSFYSTLLMKLFIGLMGRTTTTMWKTHQQTLLMKSTRPMQLLIHKPRSQNNIIFCLSTIVLCHRPLLQDEYQ